MFWLRNAVVGALLWNAFDYPWCMVTLLVGLHLRDELMAWWIAEGARRLHRGAGVA